MDECIFCKIVKKELPAEVVYEDDTVVAFLDIKPVHPGHTLLVPKLHARNVLAMDEEEARVFSAHLPKIARAVKEGVHADGVTIAINNEAAGGQIIFHAHAHIIPRYTGDNLTLWPKEDYAPGAAEETGEKIRAAMR